MIRNRNGIKFLDTIEHNTLASYMRGCSSKKDFFTVEKADFVVKKMLQNCKDGEDHSSLHSYQCPHCGCFHIGHKNKRKVNPCSTSFINI